MTRADDDAAPALSLTDAYLAMYYFVREYWERGGRRDGSVTLLLTDLGPTADALHPEAARPGWVWVPHRWVSGPNGYRLVEGHWEQRR